MLKMTLRMATFDILTAVVVGSILLVTVSADGVCEGVSKFPSFLANPDDCSSFFICMGYKNVEMRCGPPNGLKVYDPVSKTCVKKGSPFDHSACKMKPKPKLCTPGVVKGDTNCARYHFCEHGQMKMAECGYPYLFNVYTRKCELFIYVKCAQRYEPKDPCEYKENQCGPRSCIPCRHRFGTCIGLPDGPQLWKQKAWTPLFVVCKNQRVLMHGDCRKPGSVRIFHPSLRECVTVASARKTGKTVGVVMVDRRGRRFQMRHKFAV